MNNAERIEKLEDQIIELRLKQYKREDFIRKFYNCLGWLGNILTIGAIVGLLGYVHVAG